MTIDPFSEDPHPMVGRGSVWPPAGFVNLWKRNPVWFKPADKPGRMVMAGGDWSALITANLTINHGIIYRTDQALHRREDFWTLPSKYGDCEDFAIKKRAALRRLGWTPGCCRIAICRQWRGGYHAVLLVEVSAPTNIVSSAEPPRFLTLVLDNLTKQIVPWHFHRYQWIAREVPGRFMWERIVPFVTVLKEEAIAV